MIDPNTLGIGLLMLSMLLAAFAAMTRFNVSQALAMALTACAFLALQGQAADAIVRSSFAHFSDIAVLFTAVAVPAHMIDRSGAFRWVQGTTGAGIGRLGYARRDLAEILFIVAMLTTTYVLAGLMHNVTSILIMTSLAIRLCDKFHVPSKHLLCGMLVASNLGGFSTKWGDTPNIVEARVWGLTNADFIREILPINVFIMMILIGATVWLTREAMAASGGGMKILNDNDMAQMVVDLRAEAKFYPMNKRLLLTGLGCLGFFIVGQAFFPAYQVAIGATTIAIAVMLDRPSERLHSLTALGGETYLVFASIFVLAGCVEQSWIGNALHAGVQSAGAAPWSIAVTGYLGTAFTEAASWATAASSAIHPLDSSHGSAWALGAGVCAGSSSLITAASAGIILSQESRRFKAEGHAISFGTYLPFGLMWSLFMLASYIVILSVFW